MAKIKKILQPEWFVEQSATWNGNYEVKFREVLTKRGYGFVFNMMQESDMFTEKFEDCKMESSSHLPFMFPELRVISSEQQTMDFNRLVRNNSKFSRKSLIHSKLRREKVKA
jgi:hypothetical protein